jgi:hypothetical protein
MRLRFPSSKIEHFARAYAYPREEVDLMALRTDVQASGYLTKDQLRRVAKWKSPRSAGHVSRNDPVYVQEVTAFALSCTSERGRIEALTLLDGVLWPTASVILHLFHTNRYPILDFRALWSVSEKVPAQYSYPFWERYVVYCRGVSERAGVSMRVLDRALWQYSKENQPAPGGA